MSPGSGFRPWPGLFAFGRLLVRARAALSLSLLVRCRRALSGGSERTKGGSLGRLWGRCRGGLDIEVRGCPVGSGLYLARAPRPGVLPIRASRCLGRVATLLPRVPRSRSADRWRCYRPCSSRECCWAAGRSVAALRLSRSPRGGRAGRSAFGIGSLPVPRAAGSSPVPRRTPPALAPERRSGWPVVPEPSRGDAWGCCRVRGRGSLASSRGAGALAPPCAVRWGCRVYRVALLPARRLVAAPTRSRRVAARVRPPAPLPSPVRAHSPVPLGLRSDVLHVHSPGPFALRCPSFRGRPRRARVVVVSRQGQVRRGTLRSAVPPWSASRYVAAPVSC